MTKIALLISPFLSLGSLAFKRQEDTKNLDVISDLIEEAQSLVQIGGGYGKVVQEILEMRTVPLKVSIFEKSESKLLLLREKFGCNVRICSEDLSSAEVGTDTDLVLWLGDFEEYGFEEQLIIFRNFNRKMTWGGTLVVDLSANISTQQEIVLLAKLSRFAFQTPRFYSSEDGQARVIYLLKKTCI